MVKMRCCCGNGSWLVAAWLCLSLMTAACTGSGLSLEERKRQSQGYRGVGEAYMEEAKRSQGFIRKEKYSLALNEFLKAEELYDQDYLLQTYLGIIYLAKERVDLSIEHFKKALKIKPDYAYAINNLGVAYLAKKDWQVAIKTFQKLTEDLTYATPHFPMANMGWAYFNLHDYNSAEKSYRQALEIEPNFYIAHNGLGNTLVTVGRLDEALGHLERATQLAPDVAELFFDLGQAYALSDQLTKAVQAYERAIELAPERPVGGKARTAVNKIKNAL